MKIFEIQPSIGIGPIQLGMSQKDVRIIFGQPSQSGIENRDFFFDGFMVNYDENDIVEFIELARSDQFKATFRSQCLHRLTVDDAIEHVNQFGQLDLPGDEPGYTFFYKDLNLILWRGSKPHSLNDEEGRHFESVALCTPGYYDS